MKKLLTVAAGLFATQVAMADGPYAGASYGFLETELGSTDFDTPTLNLAVGNQFNENISAELRLGFGLDEDSSFGADLEIDKYWALYLKPTLPVADNFSVYALLGHADTTVDSSIGDDDDSDFSYGFGAAATISHNVDIFAEYLSLYDDDDVEISGFAIGVNGRF